jgi:hypothetical protein
MTTNLLEKFNSIKAQSDAPTAPTPAPAASTPAVRGGNVKPNRYGGKCEKCRSWVEPGAGSFRKGDTGWIVFHVECPEAVPFRITSTDQAVPDEGLYVLDDERIVKIKSNKAGTGRYASVWVEIGGHRLTEAGEYVNGEWEYAPALRSFCKPERRMTIEQAKAFGVLYGKCAKCGRHLSDAESVERGIGPVCLKSFSAVA